MSSSIRRKKSGFRLCCKNYDDTNYHVLYFDVNFIVIMLGQMLHYFPSTIVCRDTIDFILLETCFPFLFKKKKLISCFTCGNVVCGGVWSRKRKEHHCWDGREGRHR